MPASALRRIFANVRPANRVQSLPTGAPAPGNNCTQTGATGPAPANRVQALPRGAPAPGNNYTRIGRAEPVVGAAGDGTGFPRPRAVREGVPGQ